MFGRDIEVDPCELVKHNIVLEHFQSMILNFITNFHDYIFLIKIESQTNFIYKLIYLRFNYFKRNTILKFF